MKYPLLPYSRLVFDMLKTNPDVYYTRCGLRVEKRKVDVARLKSAIETALRNHPVLSMRVDEEGMQEYEPLSDIMHGQYHSVDFYEEGEKVRVEIAYNRILGDAGSEMIAFEDICRAYQHLPLLPDSYVDYLSRVEQLKQSGRYHNDEQWLEAEFDDLNCPVRPHTDSPISGNETPIEGTLLADYGCLQNAINELSRKELLPVTAFFSLACALAILEYNHTDEAALTWAYEGRELPDEQRVFGSLHRDIPFKIQKSKIDNRESVIRIARKQYREGIAHSTFPYTLTPPHTEIWNYALNVLVQPTIKDMDIPFPLEVLETDMEPKIAYALLDVEIFEGDKLCINYRYSATHYKPESIRKFAALVRKYVEWLID